MAAADAFWLGLGLRVLGGLGVRVSGLGVLGLGVLGFWVLGFRVRPQ